MTDFRTFIRDGRESWWRARGVEPTRNLLALPVKPIDAANTGAWNVMLKRQFEACETHTVQ